jgi:lipopolysaccharide transport system ATP-binding protein
VVIRVESLGKKYALHHEQSERYKALRDVVAHQAKAAGRLLNPFTLAGQLRKAQRQAAQEQAASEEEFWALMDVSFEICRGERVGIIGRNGAGKSTLLKILSRITEPTTGRVEIRGRVASLLEVGTGFHPELTGRENIFLNGAILGMTRREIRSKFDEIVGFAEVEKFLDTPVKRYSSGMYVRLAFAVASHLEPDILVIDEVLAVGDAQFQNKCLGKLSDVSAGGRTVLFVSHNINAIEKMCSRVILLQGGTMVEDTSDIRQGISIYLGDNSDQQDMRTAWLNPGSDYDHSAMRPLYFAVVDENGQPLTGAASNDQNLSVEIRMLVKLADPLLSVGFVLYNGNSDLLLWSISTDGPEQDWPQIDVGEVEIRCPLPRRLLNEGRYRLEINAGLHHREYICRPGYHAPEIFFEIRGGLSDSPYWIGARPGLLAPEWKWIRVA